MVYVCVSVWFYYYRIEHTSYVSTERSDIIYNNISICNGRVEIDSCVYIANNIILFFCDGQRCNIIKYTTHSIVHIYDIY